MDRAEDFKGRETIPYGIVMVDTCHAYPTHGMDNTKGEP